MSWSSGRIWGILVMTFRLLARKYRGAFFQSRNSPISRTAVLLIFVLVTVGVISSIATGLMITSLPNMILLIPAVLIVDVLSQFTPRTNIVAAVQTVIYGILFLVTLSLCAVIAAYSMQRFAFPLQDRHLEKADLALGFDWSAFAHWVDRHLLVQDVFHFAYHTIMSSDRASARRPGLRKPAQRRAHLSSHVSRSL